MSEKEEMKINLGSEITDLITNLTNINDEFEKLNPTYVQLAYYLVETYADNTSFGQQVIDAGKQENNGYMQLDFALKIQFDKEHLLEDELMNKCKELNDLNIGLKRISA